MKKPGLAKSLEKIRKHPFYPKKKKLFGILNLNIMMIIKKQIKSLHILKLDNHLKKQ